MTCINSSAFSLHALGSLSSFAPRLGLFVLSLSFWALIITATYTANLASGLISEHQPVYPATSLEEAQLNQVPVCVVKGVSRAQKIKQNFPLINLVEVSGSFSLQYEYLRDGKCGLVADTVTRFRVMQRNESINHDCSLQWVGRQYDIGTGGPATIVDAGTLCTSLVGHGLNYFLQEMTIDGFIESALEDYLISNSELDCAETVENDNPNESFQLGMFEMGGIFIAHGSACLFALAVSLIERWRKLRKRQRSNHETRANIEIRGTSTQERDPEEFDVINPNPDSG